MDKEYNQKRIHPPIWQHDYLVLTRLYKILQRIRDKYFLKNQILLDYGSGTAPYKELLRNHIEKYIGADISTKDGADLVVAENEPIPLPNNSVNIVLSTQVLEHVKDVPFYLKETYRVLKKDGIVIISTHGIWPYHPYPEDYNRWTRPGLINSLESTGFNILQIDSILGPLASATQFKVLFLAEKLIPKGIMGKLLLFFIALTTNLKIYIEDKFFPPKGDLDASVFVICARKT